jgi:hypothetical protein
VATVSLDLLQTHRFSQPSFEDLKQPIRDYVLTHLLLFMNAELSFFPSAKKYEDYGLKTKQDLSLLFPPGYLDYLENLITLDVLCEDLLSAQSDRNARLEGLFENLSLFLQDHLSLTYLALESQEELNTTASYLKDADTPFLLTQTLSRLSRYLKIVKSSELENLNKKMKDYFLQNKIEMIWEIFKSRGYTSLSILKEKNISTLNYFKLYDTFPKYQKDEPTPILKLDSTLIVLLTIWGDNPHVMTQVCSFFRKSLLDAQSILPLFSRLANYLNLTDKTLVKLLQASMETQAQTNLFSTFHKMQHTLADFQTLCKFSSGIIETQKNIDIFLKKIPEDTLNQLLYLSNEKKDHFPFLLILKTITKPIVAINLSAITMIYLKRIALLEYSCKYGLLDLTQKIVETPYGQKYFSEWQTTLNFYMYQAAINGHKEVFNYLYLYGLKRISKTSLSNFLEDVFDSLGYASNRHAEMQALFWQLFNATAPTDRSKGELFSYFFRKIRNFAIASELVGTPLFHEIPIFSLARTLASYDPIQHKKLAELVCKNVSKQTLLLFLEIAISETGLNDGKSLTGLLKYEEISELNAFSFLQGIHSLITLCEEQKTAFILQLMVAINASSARRREALLFYTLFYGHLVRKKAALYQRNSPQTLKHYPSRELRNSIARNVFIGKKTWRVNNSLYYPTFPEINVIISQTAHILFQRALSKASAENRALTPYEQRFKLFIIDDIMQNSESDSQTINAMEKS